MRVGFLVPSSREPIGGTIVTYELANALARRGHAVHLGHAGVWGPAISGLHDIPWFSFEGTITHQFAQEGDAPPADLRCDIAFGVGTEAAAAIGALPATIVQGFGMFDHEAESRSLRHPGLKVCVASWLIEAAHHLGTPREQCALVPNGIDHETFRVRTPIDERPPTVVMLAHTHPAKGTRAGLAVLEQVHVARPDARVVLFSAHALDVAVPPWAEHVQGTGHRELSGLFDRSAVMLQASAYEGFGLTAVEAMACGAALATTDNGGSWDYAFDRRTALVSPTRDLDGLARDVIALLDHPDERVALATAGRDSVERFRWDESGRLLEAAIERYLADPAPYLVPPGLPRLDDAEPPESWARSVLAAPRPTTTPTIDLAPVAALRR